MVFTAIFFVVKNTVYANLDNDLNFELKKHTQEITVIDDTIYFTNKAELEEREHLEVQVNPVFVQITGKEGLLLDKSPNLKENRLFSVKNQEVGNHYNSILAETPIRQVQLPIIRDGKTKGYVVAAMSLTASLIVITKLGNTLLLSYPILLLGLFFISSFLAGRSIKPIRSIIATSRRITRNNLNERVVLPNQRTNFTSFLQP